jgi:hypothetical protein
MAAAAVPTAGCTRRRLRVERPALTVVIVWTIYGLPLRLADNARRFDASPAWFSALGAGLTLPWLASLDGAAVEAHTVGLANRARAELTLPQQDSVIVSIPIADTADELRAAGNRASVRAGAVRVGPPPVQHRERSGPAVRRSGR